MNINTDQAITLNLLFKLILDHTPYFITINKKISMQIKEINKTKINESHESRSLHNTNKIT